MNRKEEIQALNEVEGLVMSRAHQLTADAVRKDYVSLLTPGVDPSIIILYEK